MFNEYEKIQDVLCYLGSSFVLKFNVVLASKDKYGNRKFFYKEYEYFSKYIDTKSVVSVKRNFRFFISIEEINNYQNSLIIGLADMPLLRGALTEGAKWLESDDVFGINKGKQLYIKQDVFRLIKLVSNSDLGLRFEPLIYVDQFGAEQRGIRMYINDIKNYTDLTRRDFLQFYELISRMNMYETACAVLASLPMTHDDASVNRSDFEDEASEQRTNRNNGKKGFFD